MASGFRWKPILRLSTVDNYKDSCVESVLIKVITSSAVVSQTKLDDVRTVNLVLIFYRQSRIETF